MSETARSARHEQLTHAVALLEDGGFVTAGGYMRIVTFKT
jgi:hypothetical protein